MSDKLRHINTISDFHHVRGLPSPLHPLISLVDYGQVLTLPEHVGERWLINYYTIGLKRDVGKFRYGQQEYDFDEGLMTFMAPGQILTMLEANIDPKRPPSGYLLLIHPIFYGIPPWLPKSNNTSISVMPLTKLCFFLKKRKTQSLIFSIT